MGDRRTRKCLAMSSQPSSRPQASNRPTVAFIGAGRAANVIGIALAKAGYDIVAVASRTRESADATAAAIVAAGAVNCRSMDPQAAADAADLLLITTSDGAIGEVGSSLRWRPGQTVAHCSGALGADVLAPAQAQGAAIGSWHPFQTLAGTAELDGVTFGIEAGPDLYETLADLARAVGGFPLAVPAEARALYHAASVLACGYLTTLLREARRIWEAAGLPEEAGRLAIGAVASATLANVRAMGEGATVTGPVSRGDMGTVQLHLESIRAAAPDLLPLYMAISRRSAVLALDAGRPTKSLEEWDALYGQFGEHGAFSEETGG
jgi:predicted short-subunit dehydrogenase-like oxidoreductase (DUF2520 family)